MIIHSYKGKHLNDADYIFTRTITDDKFFLQKCISLDQELKDALFDKGSINEGMNFINFLQMNYTNEEIIGVLESIEMFGAKFVQDGMMFFRSIDDRLLFYNYKKVENNFIYIYNEFIKLKAMEDEWLETHPIDYSYYFVNNQDYIPV